VRTLVVWCPDWPVVAAGVPLDQPAAVFQANRVTASSPAARREGITMNMRRREAQARSPDLVVLEHDPARDARAFGPLLAALDALTPRIELSAPGRCAFPTRGPARYFGGDERLARLAVEAVAAVLGPPARVAVGIADGPFAAALAARRSPLEVAAPTRPVRYQPPHPDEDPGDPTLAVHPTLVVPAGESPAFLAPLPLAYLPWPELVDVLARLGLRTLGELAALPAADVLARFGAEGALAHRLASGLDERPPATRPPEPVWTADVELDPPAERVEQAAFAARSPAEELFGRLAAQGLTCTRVLVVTETEHGERLERLWRAEGTGAAPALTPGALVDRVRWQLDGWLTGTSTSNGASASRPTAGITLVRLVPDEVGPATGRQLGFWGGVAGADERVLRSLARLEGLLGPEAVTVPEWRGGRSPGEAVARVPAGAVDLTGERRGARPDSVPAPWPGRLPAPSPTVVHPQPRPAVVADADGQVVGVNGRGMVSAPPSTLTIEDSRRSRPPVPRAVLAWAGPWPTEERWWDPAGSRRRARFQVVTDDGVARLVTLEGGRWWVEATYD
jgi:protein ImuB